MPRLSLGASATGGSGGIGDVVGPGSSVDGQIALFDGTTGKLLKTSSGFTQGSIPFFGANGVLAQDNSNLFFNDTTNRMGLGTNSLQAAKLTIATTGEYGIHCVTSGNDGIYMETDFQGVEGRTTGNTANAVGIYGFATDSGIGVEGDSINGTGVYAYSENSYGLWAESENDITAHFKTLNTAGTNANPTVVIEQNTSQTAPLLEFRNSSSTAIGSFTTNGSNTFADSIGFLDTSDFRDSATLTKIWYYDLTGATAGTATGLQFNQTAGRTIAFPDASGTLALTSDLHDAVTIGTANGLSLVDQEISLALSSTSTTGALSSTDWNTFNGKQASGNYITALTGDVTASGPGSVAATLATVNSNVGSFGSSTSIPSFTVNAKGLITAASGNAVIAPAGTLTGTTLNSTVVTSSLTSVGTIGTGTWQGTAVGAGFGGTGLTSYTAGDLLYATAATTLAKLGIGTNGQVLTVVSGAPAWAAAGSGSGDVVGPGSATDNAVARFDGGTGKLIQNSVVLIGDTGVVTGVTDLTISGSTASNFINASGTLNDATGDETAYVFDFTVNKSTSGTTRGIKSNMTDTSSPGTAYLMELQRNGSMMFRVNENGNVECGNITMQYSPSTLTGSTASGGDLKLQSTSHAVKGNVQIVDNILFDGTIFKTSAASFTIRDQINRDILVANATDLFINDVPVTIENQVTINDNIVITQDASGSGTPSPAMTLTAGAHDLVTASTEFHDLFIDLQRNVRWATLPPTLQRALYITNPSYNCNVGATTMNEAVTVAIRGCPNLVGGSGMNLTTSIGFKMEQFSIPSGISTGIGFVIYSPTTGGASTVSTGSFMDGNLGVNTLSPQTWLDVRVPNLVSLGGNDVTCIDGTTRYPGMYVGGTSIVVANTNSSGLMVDFGWAPTSNSSAGVHATQNFMSLEGSVNMSGGVSNAVFTLTERGTGGTGTNHRAVAAVYNTASGSSRAVTTGRPFLFSSNLQGSQTVTTWVGADGTLTNGASSTIISGHYIRLNNPSNSGTIVNFDAILIEASTITPSTRHTALRVLGTAHHSRHVPNLIIGADATPGHRLEVQDGNIAITNTGTAGELRLYEPSASGSNYTAFKTQAQAGNVTYTLPAADAAASGYSLTSDGAGTLSWTNVSGGGGSHALLSATHSDTVANAVSRGSIIIGNSTPAWTELTIGAANTVLKSDGTDVSWGTVPQTSWSAYKASDTARNTTTTLTADPDLDIDVTWENSQKYIIEGMIRFDNSGSATPDLDFQFNGPAVAEVNILYSTTRVGNTNVSLVGTTNSFVNGGTAGITQDMAASGEYLMYFSGGFTTSGTPGTNDLEFQWAQNVSNGTNVSVKAGSWMRVSKVQ